VATRHARGRSSCVRVTQTVYILAIRRTDPCEYGLHRAESPVARWLFRLGQQTVAHHATADAQRLALMSVTSASHYRALLVRIYGFEGAVESWASAAEGLSAASAGARSRKGRLYRDLLALGLTELEIATLPAAPVDLRSKADGLGWLFVIERHVLLAGLIRRILTSELREVFATARSYLDTHVDGGARFREFAYAATDAAIRGDVRPDALLGAARAAFDAQHQWYARTAPRRRQSSISSRPRNAA
jgi:heme oxygenase